MSRWKPILALLNAHFATMPGFVLARVSFPNKTFTKPTNLIWWAIGFIPTDTESALGAGGSTHEKGIYQLSVYAPANAEIWTALAAADSIVAHFDRVTLTGTDLKVQCSVPVPGPMLVETDWVQIPVSIRFLAL